MAPTRTVVTTIDRMLAGLRRSWSASTITSFRAGALESELRHRQNVTHAV
ncbi:hypothetical protein [Mycobacterium sp. HUMS_1102779]